MGITWMKLMRDGLKNVTWYLYSHVLRLIRDVMSRTCFKYVMLWTREEVSPIVSGYVTRWSSGYVMDNHVCDAPTWRPKKTLQANPWCLKTNAIWMGFQWNAFSTKSGTGENQIFWSLDQISGNLQKHANLQTRTKSVWVFLESRWSPRGFSRKIQKHSF